MTTFDMETLLDITQIQAILPHRYPFLLVDRIIEYEPGKRVVGIKNVTLNEPFFQGHFPGAPVMPGVLIVESMAQTAGVMMLANLPDRDQKLVFFTGIDGAKFRRPVVPGDQLRLELTVLRLRPRYIKLRGEAYVGEHLVAEAQISSSLVDRSVIERSDQNNHAAFSPVEP
ncbi:MAG TPA: 3-hydroxyacyl-ACP dehydratase FabZ [Blastocatellia bacterium]|jgi:beta-hydroxyacyl-ACP dehydratase FabZ|nr:3-hydroxyacyl-ACP dehydratase FabZ [Blastocatellia bacterium]